MVTTVNTAKALNIYENYGSLEKGTFAKMARGEMVRFMAENEVANIEGIKRFNRLNYHFSEGLSDNNTYVFLRGE